MTSAMTATALTLSTPAFSDGNRIPERFTCDGENRSPALSWNGASENVHSFALIMHDPDGTKGDFTHWVLFDLPGTSTGIPEGGSMIRTGITGRNGFGNLGYGGPCPPPGRAEHRYMFDLYALDIVGLGLDEGAERQDVEASMQGHIVGQAQLMGTYERK